MHAEQNCSLASSVPFPRIKSTCLNFMCAGFGTNKTRWTSCTVSVFCPLLVQPEHSNTDFDTDYHGSGRLFEGLGLA